MSVGRGGSGAVPVVGRVRGGRGVGDTGHPGVHDTVTYPAVSVPAGRFPARRPAVAPIDSTNGDSR